jgi:hypothetical protein
VFQMPPKRQMSVADEAPVVSEPVLHVHDNESPEKAVETAALALFLQFTLLGTVQYLGVVVDFGELAAQAGMLDQPVVVPYLTGLLQVMTADAGLTREYPALQAQLRVSPRKNTSLSSSVVAGFWQ